MASEFFTQEEVEIIQKFVALHLTAGSRAMASGFMADGPRALQYGAMQERLLNATREAERLFSLAAWRLDCERSWEVLREEQRKLDEVAAQMDAEDAAGMWEVGA